MVQNTNYYMLMEKQIEEYSKSSHKKRLLLHCCCAPCSSHCLEILKEYFNITAYFYNPNITDYDEYIKRWNELLRFVNQVYTDGCVDTYLEEHDKDRFLEMAKGMEHYPERGERCYKCYRLRMEKAAAYAKENDYDCFTTTLSISPHKNATWINEIGAELSKIYNIDYLYSDFKKKNGYKRSIELSAEYGLYRQNFCGCEFSRRL
ncbi:MAG: epoxyqueuosine reductase QueH [Coprococcus sp.]